MIVIPTEDVRPVAARATGLANALHLKASPAVLFSFLVLHLIAIWAVI